MVGEEGGGAAEGVAKSLHAEEIADFLLDGFCAIFPNHFKDFADAGNDVLGVVLVVHQDAGPGNT